MILGVSLCDIYVTELPKRITELLKGRINSVAQINLIRAANAYIEENDIDLECRFDIISIVFAENKHQVDHIEDAFYSD